MSGAKFNSPVARARIQTGGEKFYFSPWTGSHSVARNSLPRVPRHRATAPRGVLNG